MQCIDQLQTRWKRWRDKVGLMWTQRWRINSWRQVCGDCVFRINIDAYSYAATYLATHE